MLPPEPHMCNTPTGVGIAVAATLSAIAGEIMSLSKGQGQSSHVSCGSEPYSSENEGGGGHERFTAMH